MIMSRTNYSGRPGISLRAEPAGLPIRSDTLYIYMILMMVDDYNIITTYLQRGWFYIPDLLNLHLRCDNALVITYIILGLHESLSYKIVITSGYNELYFILQHVVCLL